MGILYLIYLSLSIWLTIVVGNSLHKNGRGWIQFLLDESPYADRLNDLLLLAYRLLNIGYILYTFIQSDRSENDIIFLTSKLGTILLILAYLHYQNILIIFILSYYKNKYKWQI